jgi:hypothetical protein
MLTRGASPYDVAKMLGDTIETVEKHYTPFVKELRDRSVTFSKPALGSKNLLEDRRTPPSHAKEDKLGRIPERTAGFLPAPQVCPN